MAKKEAVLAVLEIFRKYDNPNGLTHNEIMEYLENDYDIKFKREKFATIIEQINSSDEYKVEYTKGRYSRYRLRLKTALTSTEAEILCALIADADVFSRLEAERLMEKICITFHTSFSSEEQIQKLKANACNGKDEINRIDKLELIDYAIRRRMALHFKIYNGTDFSERKTDIPVEWFTRHGELIVRFQNSQEKLSQIIDLRQA